MSNEEKEIFEFDETSTKRLMKKAKIKSTLKIVAIIIIIVPIVFIVMTYALYQLSQKNASNIDTNARLFEQITRPNVHISTQVINLTLLGGEIKTQTYKLIGNQPYIWDTIEGSYNLLGQYSIDTSASNTIKINSSSSLKETNQFTIYNIHNGDREMFFYHPRIVYDKVKDDVYELNKLDSTLSVELALSFDKSYTLEEVKAMIPTNVNKGWYWVDGYSEQLLSFFEEEQDTVSAKSPYMYGFQDYTPPDGKQIGENAPNEIDAFIYSVNQLYNNHNFKRKIAPLYDAIVGSNQVLDKEDIKIIGVVVTGSVEELKTLQNQSYIRASTFGVITNFAYASEMK